MSPNCSCWLPLALVPSPLSLWSPLHLQRASASSISVPPSLPKSLHLGPSSPVTLVPPVLALRVLDSSPRSLPLSLSLGGSSPAPPSSQVCLLGVSHPLAAPLSCRPWPSGTPTYSPAPALEPCVPALPGGQPRRWREGTPMTSPAPLRPPPLSLFNFSNFSFRALL